MLTNGLHKPVATCQSGSTAVVSCDLGCLRVLPRAQLPKIHRPEGIQYRFDFLQSRCRPVVEEAAIPADYDQTRCVKNLRVIRDGGLRQAKRLVEARARDLSLAKDSLHNPHPRVISQRVEDRYNPFATQVSRQSHRCQFSHTSPSRGQRRDSLPTSATRRPRRGQFRSSLDRPKEFPLLRFPPRPRTSTPWGNLPGPRPTAPILTFKVLLPSSPVTTVGER